jgi:hypothetical protein
MVDLKRIVLALRPLLVLTMASMVVAQTWNYNTLNSYSGALTPSYVTLEKRTDGKASLKIIGGQLNACARTRYRPPYPRLKPL